MDYIYTGGSGFTSLSYMYGETANVSVGIELGDSHVSCYCSSFLLSSFLLCLPDTAQSSQVGVEQAEGDQEILSCNPSLQLTSGFESQYYFVSR